MADETPVQPTSVDPNALDTTAPQFAPQVIYLKDVSFESPMALRLPPDALPVFFSTNLGGAIRKTKDPSLRTGLRAEEKKNIGS